MKQLRKMAAIYCGLHAAISWGQATNVFPSSGNVGIGTTNPDAPFTIYSGNTNHPNNSGIGLLNLEGTGTGLYRLYMGMDTSLPNPSGFIQSNYYGTSWQPLLLNPNGASVGIGTTNPGALLHLEANAGSPYVWEKYTAGGTMITQLQRTGNGTEVQSYGHIILTPGTSGSGAVGIGTTDPCTNSQSPANCKLSVAGAIQAYDVTVNNMWSDYVFDPSYHLAPLTEVAGYIQQHHHLPDIPSAQEVQEKGVSLGDMQAKLLAKIEELTLHMIRAEEENHQLRARIARLEARGDQ